MRSIRFPVEANSELIVYPYVVLSNSVALESLQPITWRNAQVEKVD